MHLQDWGNVGTQPAKPSATVTPGYPTNGSPPGTAPTVLDARYLSVVFRELYAAVTDYVAADRTDDEQLKAVLGARIKAILCSSTDTTETSTTHKRAIVAVTDSRASGANSACVATDDYHASGQSSAAVASESSTSTAQAVAALRSIVAACLDCGTAGSGGREAAILASELSDTTATARAAAIVAALYASVTGTRGAAIACEGTSGVKVGVTGTNAAIIAAKRTSGAAADAGGAQSLVAAADDTYISTGTNNAAALACKTSYVDDGGEVALLAVEGCSIDGGNPAQSAIVASQSCRANAVGNVLLVGSANAEVASRTNGVALGYSASTLTPSGSDQNLTMWLDSENGSGNGSAWNTSGADYAEFFELLPGSDPLPYGAPVGLVEHEGAMYATIADDGEEPIGIVSAAPGVLGNDDSMGWAGKFARGPMGEYLLSESGHRITAEDYDRSQAHIPRSKRPTEWVCVGMMGQIRAIVTAEVKAGSWLAPKGGALAPSKKPTRLRALRIVSPGVALVLIR